MKASKSLFQQALLKRQKYSMKGIWNPGTLEDVVITPGCLDGIQDETFHAKEVNCFTLDILTFCFCFNITFKSFYQTNFYVF